MLMAASLFSLPPEIIWTILSYIPEEDHVLLAATHPKFKEIVINKGTQRSLNLTKAYFLAQDEIKSYFYKSTFSLYIQKLVLTNLWWFNVGELVQRCSNVQTLHLHGANITLHSLFKALAACPKVDDLAFDLPCISKMETISIFRAKEVMLSLRKIKTLSISLISVDSTMAIRYFENVVNLKVINKDFEWYYDYPYGFYYFKKMKEIYIHFSNTRFVIPISHNAELHKFEHFDFDILWGCKATFEDSIDEAPQCRRLFLLHPIPPRIQFPHLEEFITCFDPPPLAHFPEVKSAHYFAKDTNDPEVAADFLCSLDLHNPLLQKLSFWFPWCPTSHLCFSPISSFQELEYLCVSPNALHIGEYAMDSEEEEEPIFKKQCVGQVSASQLSHESEFNEVFQGCNKLSYLEIGLFYVYLVHGQMFSNEINKIGKADLNWSLCWQCLENISKLEKLTHLTLDSIPIQDGKFFLKIAQECRHIEFLRITDLGSEGKCCFLKDFCIALPQFQSLQTLRFEQGYIFGNDDLFTALESCSKLTKVFILSLKNDYFNCTTESLTKLITGKQLAFLCICMGGSRISASLVEKLNAEIKKCAPHYLFFQMIWHSTKENLYDQIPHGFFEDLIVFKPWIFDM